MAWTPTDSLLGTHGELVTFSHNVSYVVLGAAGDPLAVPPVEATADIHYNVRLIPQETNPNTISFTAADPATISGYYKGIFNDSLTTRNLSGTLTTITTLQKNASVFDAVDPAAKHVISFKADTTRSKTFTYLAEAYDPLTPTVVVASKSYTVLAQDKNWSPGQVSLKQLITNTENT